MKLQRCHDVFILKEDVLTRMLKILHSIIQDLEKFWNRKSLHITHIYGFDEIVCDDATMRKMRKTANLFVSLDNIIPSKKSINWSFMSTTNTPHTNIDLDHLPKFNDYFGIMEQ